MRKTKLQALALNGSADEVEARFYEAMLAGDVERLMACWADDEEVVCVHPGGARLCGVGAIRSTFEAMFANGNVRVTPERVRKIEALASAVHNLVERIEVQGPQGMVQAYLLATNVYHKTPQGWRMVLHHASPGSLSDLADLEAAPQVLH